MFSEKDTTLLADIIKYAEYTIKFTEGTTFDEFAGDIKTALAVERCIAVIGEAASKLSRQVKDASPSIPWHDISSMRHRVVHDYSGINIRIVWQTATNDLAPLIKECTRLLAMNADSKIDENASNNNQTNNDLEPE